MEKIVAQELAGFLGMQCCMSNDSKFDDLDFDMDLYTEAYSIHNYDRTAFALIATKNIRKKLDRNKLAELLKGHLDDYKKWAAKKLHIITQDRNCPINFKNLMENFDKQYEYWSGLDCRIAMDRFIKKD
jgi:hypothetical protein